MLVVMETGSKADVNEKLSLLRERGKIQFDRVLAIPTIERIPGIVAYKKGRMRVSAVLSASITSALDNMNLRVGMNEDQVFDLAEEIIDQSFEDNLAIEDILLFLKELITGKTGKIYDRMDMPTFFEQFEKYRQLRHLTLQRIREEQDAQNKSYGSPDRWSDMNKDEERNAFHEAMKTYVKDKKPDECT
jgi:hypothetical protein